MTRHVSSKGWFMRPEQGNPKQRWRHIMSGAVDKLAHLHNLCPLKFCHSFISGEIIFISGKGRELVGRALARTRHAHHFNGNFNFWRAWQIWDDGLKIPKMTGSIPAKLKKSIKLALIFQFRSHFMVYCSIMEQNQHKIIFKLNNLFRIQV